MASKVGHHMAILAPWPVRQITPMQVENLHAVGAAAFSEEHLKQLADG
ncbi:hypothetical protein [Pseudomonas sp. RIT-To-2]